ncbi:MAG TPA: phenylalanine--tRNA ligase subunit beta [Patescibacteria group bacterium]|nr:phenylalanine--tRNA ligase subunit beta [Patescibacteria group bacterium]
MALISINRKIFEKEIGKLNEEMQHKIAMLGTPIDKIDENELQIEIFPNRPDMLSYHGFKRSFLAFLEKQKGMKKYKINKPENDFIVNIDPSVSNVRPYTACAVVKKLKLDNEKIKELIDIQEKLHITIGRKRKKLAIGIYPLEKIKFPITFTALEPDKIKFIPLEMDKELSGLQILQKHPTGREYAHLLAGKEKFPIFIDANNSILSMPPVINSQLAGKITEETRDVFVECSGFDFSVLSKCLNIIVSTLSDMGGEIYQMKLNYRKNKKITPDFSPEKLKINIENANKMLGIKLNENHVKKLLEKMGHDYSKGIVEIPPWRTDILHEVDLIEDIAIAYGYDNFVPEIPEISTIGGENQREIIKRKISEILSGMEMLEVMNYHLTNKKDQFEKMGIKAGKDFIEIEESKTDYNVLRKDLSHYLMKILSENVDSEYPQKIFELGKIFLLKNNEVAEEENLSLASAPSNFTELRQVLEYLFRMLNLGDKITIKEPESFPSYFAEGRIGEIFLDTKSIGFIGEIHPKILKNWHMKMPVALLEISLEEVFKKLE